MDIKKLNESFHRLYEEICDNAEDELSFEDIDFDPSVEGELTEAKISPEDKHDSDLIRSIYAKANARGARMDRLRGSLTPEEKEVFDKYNLSFGTKPSKDWGRNMFSNGKKVRLGKLPISGSDYAVSNPDINLADLARKRNTRDPYSNIARRISGKRSDDEIQSKFERDKYALKDISRRNRGFSDEIKDLETGIEWRKDNLKKIKNIEKNLDGRRLHYSDTDIDRLEAELAGKKAALNTLKKKQPYYDEKHRQALDDFYMDRFGKTPKAYDERKADWKQSIADRRAKKNESYLKESWTGSPEDDIWEAMEEMYNQGYSKFEVKQAVTDVMNGWLGDHSE